VIPAASLEDQARAWCFVNTAGVSYAVNNMGGIFEGVK
jgi:hypothetical protein